MNDELLTIFKMVINDDEYAKNRIIDYIANNGTGQKEIPVRIGQQRFYITEREYDSMAGIIRSAMANNWENSGMKIPMIKALRELTLCGLKEAKDAVENKDNWYR